MKKDSLLKKNKIPASLQAILWSKDIDNIKPLEYSSIMISSYKDIASDKAYAIGRRPVYRDYIDLFIILKNKFSLKQIIEDSKEKFSGEFSEKLFLSQLIYFEDLKDFVIDFIGKEYKKEEIRKFFHGQITDYRNTVFDPEK